MKTNETEEEFKVFPLTPDRWGDFETLFGEKGSACGCWCLWWRIQRSQFMKMSVAERKANMHELVQGGTMPGVLLYEGTQPIGWCAISPKEDLYPLAHSKTILPVDDQPAWAIVCFFVNRAYRQKGLMKVLVRGAIDFSRQHGARIIEAYPSDMQSDKLAGKKLTGYHGFMGIASAFRELGFVEVGRVNETQLIMRNTI